MSCKDLENDLLMYVDRRLNDAEKSRVESHLASCAACRKEAEDLRRTWHLLGYLPGRTATGNLPARLLDAARLQLAIERRWSHRILKHAPLIASAALLLIVVGVTMLMPRGTTPNLDAEYATALASLSDPEDREVVQNLDLYENLGTVENIDVLEDSESVEYLDLISSLTDEDF